MESQRITVFLGELKHEVLRKSVKLSFHSLVEVEACHLIELGEVAVQHDFTLADEVDPALDHFQGDDLLLWGLFLRQILSLLNIGALSNPPFYLSLPPDLSQQTSRFHRARQYAETARKPALTRAGQQKFTAIRPAMAANAELTALRARGPGTTYRNTKVLLRRYEVHIKLSLV